MKKALLTTTALVALCGASFADSVAVVNGGTSHHTHSPTVVFHGEAMVKYNVPLKLTNGQNTDGTVSSDVDLDVTMTSPGAYSATVSYGMEGNAIAGATVTATTPLLNVSVGAADARGGAGGGADAADLYADIDHMTNIGADEDNSDWYISLPNFGGWTVAASGKNDMSTTANKNMTYCKQGVFNFLRAYYHFKSYDYEKNKPHELINSSVSQLTQMPEYYIMSNNLGMSQTVKKYMPSQSQIKKCLWLSDNDLKVYADSFIKNSFQGPLNWYKMMLSKKENKNIKNLSLPNYITLPCIFLAGKADWGIYQKPWQLNNMKKLFKNFYGTTIIENAGHWVQQEQPKKTFEAINNFYKRIS